MAVVASGVWTMARVDELTSAVLIFTMAATLGLGVGLGLFLRRLVASEREVVRARVEKDDLDAFAGRVAHDLKNLLAPLPLETLALN